MKASAQHWASVGERTFVAGTWLLWCVYRIFGRSLFSVCLIPVVGWYWAVSPMARAASLQYLQRVQNAQAVIGHAPDWHDTLHHFLSFAQALLDKLLVISGRYPFDEVRCEGWDSISPFLKAGRGAVIVTAHCGCLELCCALAQRISGRVLTVLVHTAHADRFNRILQRLDPGNSVCMLQVSQVNAGTAVLLGECIKRGELVVIVGDRVPLHASKTVSLPFLGVQALLPVGAYMLAALLQCPLFFMGCVREASCHVVVCEELADRVDLPRSRRDEALKEMAQRYVASLEALLRRAPYDWFNFFPFWDQGSTT